jgi:glycosyltransferase involved in cell wall biosynthesis
MWAIDESIERPRKRVLLVAMVDSIHVARWIEQFSGEDLEFVLFPSTPNRRVHPIIRARTSNLTNPLRVRLATHIRVVSLSLGILDLCFGHRLKGALLRRYSRGKDFDFVHVLEFQHAGYIAVRAWEKVAPPAPLIATNWGSDIFWFQHFPKHRRQLSKLLSMANYYSAECLRDWALARELGFQGEYLPVIPNAGGFAPAEIWSDVDFVPPSRRSSIAVKGYDRFVGLADIALDALELVADSLRSYEIVVYSASWRIRRRARRLANTHGLVVTAIHPQGLSHSQMLELFRRSRLYLGLSQSDGISTSLLESLAQGCFPIQTGTSCCDEWITDGETGMVVSEPTAASVALRLKQALADDELVDRAAERNVATARDRLSDDSVRAVARTFYEASHG